MDPVVRAVVDEQWSKLDLDDPEGRVRDAIASFPLDAVLAAIATFEAKKTKNTLPPDVDARYLLGIVRNISQTDEGQAITEALLRIRLEARDRMLAQLVSAREALLASSSDSDSLIRAAIDRAMGARRNLDRLFWLELAARLIADREPPLHAALVRNASRRIHSFFAVPYWDRLTAARFLAERVIPLAYIPPNPKPFGARAGPGKRGRCRKTTERSAERRALGNYSERSSAGIGRAPAPIGRARPLHGPAFLANLAGELSFLKSSLKLAGVRLSVDCLTPHTG